MTGSNVPGNKAGPATASVGDGERPVALAWRIVRYGAAQARLIGPARIILSVLGILAIVAAVRPDLLTAQHPDAIDATAILKGPSWHHLLGTNEEGSDVLSRLIYGTRLDLFIAVGSTALALVVGLPAGLLAGYRGRFLDQFLRSAAVSTLAFPLILFAMLIVASFGASMTSLIAVLGFLFLPQVFLVTRAQTRTVRQREYVTASVVTGLRTRRVLLRHVLPNVVGPILVLVPQLMATAILAEAGLSYLGLGVQPPSITWGTILLDSKNYYQQQPFYAASAGLMVTAAAGLLILAGDLIGQSRTLGRRRRNRLTPRRSRPLRQSPADAVGLVAVVSAEGPGVKLGAAVAPAAAAAQAQPSVGEPAPLVSVRDLQVTYAGVGGGRIGLRAVDGVSFEIGPGECLAVVGESGSGKSSIARALVRMVRAHGVFELRGVNFFGLRGEALRSARRSVQLVFQTPQGSIDPRQTARQVIAEPLEAHRLVERSRVGARVEELMRQVGFDPALADRRARELSGGQCQRLAIARCLAVGAQLVICDEPTSALDVSVQAQIINLLKDLQERDGTSYLFISHNLAVVRQLAHRVAVVYQGRIVELASSDELFVAPLHPYTRELMRSVSGAPATVRSTGSAAVASASVSGGCAYAARCRHADGRCWSEAPLPETTGEGHLVECHHWEPVALSGKQAAASGNLAGARNGGADATG